MSDPAVVWTPTLAAGARIVAGGSAFSSPPLMSEVNASNDQNQVVGLVNRRTSQIDNSLSQFSYIAPGTVAHASLVTALQTRINTLRADAGVSVFSFTAVTAGAPVRAQDWLDLRSALVFTPVPPPLTLFGFRYASAVSGNSYPTPGTAYSDGLYASNSLVGKRVVNNSGACQRHRLMASFTIPSGVSALGSYRFDIVLSFFNNQIETFSPHFYLANSDLSSGGGSWWTNRDIDLGAGVYGSGASQAIVLSGAQVASRAGSKLCIIFGEDLELNNAGTYTLATNDRATFEVNTSQFPAIALTQDFGF